MFWPILFRFQKFVGTIRCPNVLEKKGEILYTLAQTRTEPYQ